MGKQLHSLDRIGRDSASRRVFVEVNDPIGTTVVNSSLIHNWKFVDPDKSRYGLRGCSVNF